MIVCLGWGSLIWDPRSLKISGAWREDGPSIGVEFLRQSMDGRLTLVLDSASKENPAFWIRMDCDSLTEARESLRDREGTSIKYIGSWELGQDAPASIPGLTAVSYTHLTLPTKA